MVCVLHVSEVAKGGIGSYLDLIAIGARPNDTHMALVPAVDAGAVSFMDKVGYPAGAGRLARVAGMMKALRRQLRLSRPDVIYLHSTFALAALPWLRIAARDIPVMYCAHGWAQSRYGPGVKRAIVRQIEGRMPALAHVVVNCSVYDGQLARENRYSGRHVVIENAGFLRAPHQVDTNATDPINLLFVGRMARQKGLDLLLDAMGRLTRRDVHLFVAGGDAPAGAVPDNVTFLGWVAQDGLTAVYSGVDAVIMPSRWEGLPMVIPEAFQAGCPMLVSDRSGLPGLIDPGRTGLSFALEPAAIAQMLEGLDKGALQAMRPACQQAFVARFHPDRFAKELHALFDALTASKH